MVKKAKTVQGLDFDSQIKCSINALMKLMKGLPKKNSLIEEGETVFLQVSIFKIPRLNEFVKRRIPLKYPTTAEIPEVCLIVRDYLMKDGVNRTDEERIDTTIERYEQVLKKHDIYGITNIMPYLQLKREYKTFELKRKLVNHFDIFLCDSHLFSKDNLFNCLGKIFIEKNKYPIAVKVPNPQGPYDPKANSRVRSAISSTVFYIKPSSDNYSICVGNTLRKKYLIQNIRIIIKKLIESDDVIPGGFKNIRSINIKGERSKAVPLYMSMTSGNDIPIPRVRPNAPRMKTVAGEISTLPGKRVVILPNGTVRVKKMRNYYEYHDEPYFEPSAKENYAENEDEEDKELEEQEKAAKKNKKLKGEKGKDSQGKKRKRSQAVKSDGEDDFEDAIESAEQKYLANLNDEAEESEGEKEVQLGKSKGVERKQKEESKPVKKLKGKIITKKPQKKLLRIRKAKK